jgi:integrase
METLNASDSLIFVNHACNVGELQLQHTLSHEECPACEASLKGVMGRDAELMRHMHFPAAAQKWLPTRKLYLKPRTYYMEEHHANTLSKFFGQIRVIDIHLGHLREYQKARLANTDGKWKRKAGPSVINHEISVLQKLLKRTSRWKEFGEYYEALPLPPYQPRKVMTDTESERLFAIASRNPEFELAYLAAALSANTGAAGTELRNIRLENIFMTAKPAKFCVETATAKNGDRGRMIPLNETAFRMMAQAIKRANLLGSYLPHHYLFPIRVCKGKWDPERAASASWLGKVFKKLREAAGLPWLTPHCLRHQFITEMLELGIEESVLMSITGQTKIETLRHYSHNRMVRQFAAVEVLDRRNREDADRLGGRRRNG